jgi:hypothetical protein
MSMAPVNVPLWLVLVFMLAPLTVLWLFVLAVVLPGQPRKAWWL